MDTIVVPGDRVRLPTLRPGTAAAVRRYDRERAFVLHPDDFHRLVTLDELASDALALASLELAPAAVDAHREESAPGESVGLFHLDPTRFSGLAQEKAAIVTALLRLPISAIDTSEELGTLEVNGLRAIHERVARAHG